MNEYVRIKKMWSKSGINTCRYPAFAQIEIKFLKFDTPWSGFFYDCKACFGFGIIGIAFEIRFDLLGFLYYVPCNPAFGYFIFLLQRIVVNTTDRKSTRLNSSH